MKRRLESIRMDLNMRQDEMAKAIGISYASYQKKERGESPLLAREFMKIHELSGVPCEDIEIPK